MRRFLFLAIAAGMYLLSCTAGNTVRDTPGDEGWLDESTFRAIGIGYPAPYDTTRDAKRKSALRAAREIALAAIELALTKNMNTDNALRMRTFIQTNAAVVKHMDHEDGHIEIMLEIYQTGLRSIVISGNAGALP